MCNDDLKTLYENLSKLLKHFAFSVKSTDALRQVQHAMGIRSVHIMNYNSARMNGFIDACLQASNLTVPLLDTIITMKIWPD